MLVFVVLRSEYCSTHVSLGTWPNQESSWITSSKGILPLTNLKWCQKCLWEGWQVAVILRTVVVSEAKVSRHYFHESLLSLLSHKSFIALTRSGGEETCLVLLIRLDRSLADWHWDNGGRRGLTFQTIILSNWKSEECRHPLPPTQHCIWLSRR